MEKTTDRWNEVIVSHYKAILKEKEYQFEILDNATIKIDGVVYHIIKPNKGFFQVQINNKSFVASCKTTLENEYEVSILHDIVHIILEDERSCILKKYQKTDAKPTGTFIVTAPMPGLITSIKVKAGEAIEKGKGILVLEAMKMENEICSSHSGKVLSIIAEKGMIVEKGQVLLRILLNTSK